VEADLVRQDAPKIILPLAKHSVPKLPPSINENWARFAKVKLVTLLPTLAFD
jgi:hypothetical protein